MGMRVIAICSEADQDAMHVRLADEVRLITGSDPRASYLDGPRIVAAAIETSAGCIHPGYGFLSENPDFAEACDKAGIAFVGPPASAMRAMGLKDQAKKLMHKAGVPIAPGYAGEDQTADTLSVQADQIGYPLMIKAVAGGGGKGMRLVTAANDFAAALEACRREARSSFGGERVLIEKYVPDARHIEFQILADGHGNCIHVLERECSLQRRHQKIIEEAPAPGMSLLLRRNMGEAAVRGAKSAGYVGAGTMEFIASADLSSFYFMEMNTRLQVEHPVTEVVTGLDLVELQFRIAAGEKLALQQDDIQPRGHAMEARLYAEDPAHDFLPQTGTAFRLNWPSQSADVRVDTGVEQGSAITPFYDPMIAKIITHGKNRREAVTRLSQALSQTGITGVKTNQRFLIDLLADPKVIAGGVTTSFLDEDFNGHQGVLTEQTKARAAATWVAARRDLPVDVWQGGWSLSGLPRTEILQLSINGKVEFVRCTRGADGFSVAFDGHSHIVQPAGTWHFEKVSGKLYLTHDSIQLEVHEVDQLARTMGDQAGAAVSRAPMTGKIIRVFTSVGERVERGAPLLVLEAMKMEHVVRAGIDGIVTTLNAVQGSTVQEGTLLCALDPATASEGT